MKYNYFGVFLIAMSLFVYKTYAMESPTVLPLPEVKKLLTMNEAVLHFWYPPIIVLGISQQLFLFYIEKDQNGVYYLTLIQPEVIEAQDDTKNYAQILAKRYLFIDSVPYGFAMNDDFVKLLNENIHITDKRLMNCVFNVLLPNKKLLTKHDQWDWSKSVQLIESNQPLLASNTYDYNMVDLCQLHSNLSMIKTISSVLSNQQLQEWADLCTNLLPQEEMAVANALDKRLLPAIIIEDLSEEIKQQSGICKMVSTNASELFIYAYINKDTCRLFGDTKTMDIDILSTVYAELILYNDKTGKYIIHHLDQLCNHPLLFHYLLSNIYQCLNIQWFKPENVLPDNLVLFAKALIKNYSRIVQFDKSLFSMNRYKMTFIIQGFLRLMIHNKEVWCKQFDDLCSSLWHSFDGELNDLCNNDDEKIFSPSLKPRIQRYVLQNYIKNILYKDKNKQWPFPEALTTHIVSYIHPEEDEHFKQWIIDQPIRIMENKNLSDILKPLAIQ